MQGFLRRLFTKDDRLTLAEHIAGMREFFVWRKKMRSLPCLPESHAGMFTAYIGAFARPQNIGPILESLLRTPEIGEIIVSENMPGVLHGWRLPHSSRIRILRHSTRQNTAMRFIHLLSEAKNERMLVLDDDLFLLPRQLSHLCAELEKDPSVPHGICGQIWRDGTLHSNIHGIESDVDVLNRVYAFTAEHLRTFDQLAKQTGTFGAGNLWSRGYCDILLSASGKGKPRIHAVGQYVDCISQGAKGVALWREQGFMDERNACFAELQGKRSVQSEL